MTLEVLLSCMHEKDLSLISQSNLNQIHTLLINQCDVDVDEMIISNQLHRMLKTKTRGLSVSRNLALANAHGDICLISDNDEIFVNNLEEKILSAYEKHPLADIIIFKVSNRPKKLGNKARKLKRWDIFRISSWQISFKLSSVKGKVSFDENLGAGTGNGAGEENHFLLDCYKQGLKMYYVPLEIAELRESESTWFRGFDKKYFYQLGATTRYNWGAFTSFLYAFYFSFTKKKLYAGSISTWNALKQSIKGVIENPLKK